MQAEDQHKGLSQSSQATPDPDASDL